MGADALKTGIANYVGSALQALTIDDPDEPELSMSGLAGLGIVSIEPHRISNMETQLRVKTEYQGVRYFTIRISESI
jgi:hypothetical protein